MLAVGALVVHVLPDLIEWVTGLDAAVRWLLLLAPA